MKKHYAFILFALLFGLVVNVLVAWVPLALREPDIRGKTTTKTFQSAESFPSQWRPAGYDQTWLTISTVNKRKNWAFTSYQAQGQRVVYFETEQRKGPIGGLIADHVRSNWRSMVMTATYYGWPTRSFVSVGASVRDDHRWEQIMADGTHLFSERIRADADVYWPTALDQGVTFRELAIIKNGYIISLTGLPTRPLPVGFAANTLFYSLPLLIPALHFARRRHRREKLGLCLKCGYDMKGLDHCPECGPSIPVPSA